MPKLSRWFRTGLLFVLSLCVGLGLGYVRPGLTQTSTISVPAALPAGRTDVSPVVPTGVIRPSVMLPQGTTNDLPPLPGKDKSVRVFSALLSGQR